MGSSMATLIDGASEQEELEEQLLRAERNLKQFYQANPVRTIHPPGQKLPPGAILKTDYDEEKRRAVRGEEIPATCWMAPTAELQLLLRVTPQVSAPFQFFRGYPDRSKTFYKTDPQFLC
jgi:hypothetical protein